MEQRQGQMWYVSFLLNLIHRNRTLTMKNSMGNLQEQQQELNSTTPGYLTSIWNEKISVKEKGKRRKRFQLSLKITLIVNQMVQFSELTSTLVFQKYTFLDENI